MRMQGHALTFDSNESAKALVPYISTVSAWFCIGSLRE